VPAVLWIALVAVPGGPPSPVRAAAPAPVSDAAVERGWEAKLDGFLRRVALGSRRVSGRFVETVPPGSRAALALLPPFVRRGERHGEPFLLVKAGVVEAAAHPGPRRTELLGTIEAAGAELRGRVGSIVSLRVPARAVETLARLDAFAWLRAARSYRLRNEVSTGPLHVASDEAALLMGTAGAGAIVGVIDTGIQWEDRDFRNADGSTRILGIWDMTLPPDPGAPPPPGFTFGRYFDRAAIDAALDGGPALATGDGHGHGTHVAGTAAGNGRETGQGVPAGTFAGVAPEADLLIVRVFDDAGAFCAECDLTAAVQFIQQTAAALGRPWVGNMSLGTDLGSHDGTDPDELAIDAAVGPGTRGAQMAIAAGNSGQRRMHWEGTLQQGVAVANTFNLAYTPRAGADNDFIWMDLWYDAPDQATVEIQGPSGSVVRAAAGEDSGVVCTADGAVQIDATNVLDALNGDNEVFAQIWDASDCGGTAVRTGTWTLRVRGDAVGTPAGAFDLWNEADLQGPTHMTLAGFTLDESVGVPGTAKHAITVAAYVGKCQWTNAGGGTTTACSSSLVGTLATFSSIGPTRDGRQKPDLAAPGQNVGSSLAGSIGATMSSTFKERDGTHGNISGTSMATPHAAGTAALLLARRPDLSGPEVRDALQRAARSDGFTGAVPNARFGYGKLRAPEGGVQAVALVNDLRATATGGFTGTADPLIQTYNVYRGPIPGLTATSYGACFLQGLPAPAFTDPAVPAGGTAFSYLAVGERDGVEGPLGTDSEGRPRPNTTPCP
jgi:subtilisin family serine protease